MTKTAVLICLSFCFQSFYVNAKCMISEEETIGDEGKINCEKKSEVLEKLKQSCLKQSDPDACSEASKRSHLPKEITKYKDLYQKNLIVLCEEKDFASDCAKLAGIFEEKHVNKSLEDLPKDEVLLRQKYWLKACSISKAKDSFFCYQKDFIKRFISELSLKCFHKISKSCKLEKKLTLDYASVLK